MINRQWRVARRPRPKENVSQDQFRLTEEPIPDVQDGQVLLKTLYLQLVPIMRLYMLPIKVTDDAVLEVGDVIHGRGVAQVLQSRHPDFQPGDIVHGQTGWQTHKVSAMTPQERFFKTIHTDLPLSLNVSVLSLAGYTAYFGLLDVGKPKEGDVVVVSGASGGVGSVVIQLARISGCRVIGITSTPEKIKYIKSLGCHDAVNRTTEDIDERLRELCPNGIDVHFDNVGGEIANICKTHMSDTGRTVPVGRISELLNMGVDELSLYLKSLGDREDESTFFIYHYQPRFLEAENQLVAWLRAGKLKIVEDVAEGFEEMPNALRRLYDSENMGVQICHVADPDPF